MLAMCVAGMEMGSLGLEILPTLMFPFQFLDCISMKLQRLLVAGITPWLLPVRFTACNFDIVMFVL